LALPSLNTKLPLFGSHSGTRQTNVADEGRQTDHDAKKCVAIGGIDSTFLIHGACCRHNKFLGKYPASYFHSHYFISSLIVDRHRMSGLLRFLDDENIPAPTT